MRKNNLIGAVALAAALGACPGAPAFAVSPSGGGPQANASGPTIDAGQRYQDGVRFLQANQFKEAKRAFSEVLSVAASDGATNYMMALADIGLGDKKDARKYLRNTVKYKADLIEAKGWLGAIEFQTGEPKRADEQKAALESLKTKCAGTCDKAKVIDEALARIAEAMAKPAAALTPRGAILLLASLNEGGTAYMAAHGLINEGKYTQGLSLLQASSLAYGPNADVLTYQGFANRKLGNYTTAIAYYSEALHLVPDHKGANEYLGEYYVELGDMTKAKAQLAKLDRICKFGCEEAEELRRWIDAKKS
ncbi:MAG: tetratricopeptide repeat protein [Pseudomonadota bacterium]